MAQDAGGDREGGGVRLSEAQIVAIKDAACAVFGADAVVRVFGSRADDRRRGGDIDLHVEARPDRVDTDHEVSFRALIWKSLDEPQIDVVLAARGAVPRWIDQAALREGVVL